MHMYVLTSVLCVLHPLGADPNEQAYLNEEIVDDDMDEDGTVVGVESGDRNEVECANDDSSEEDDTELEYIEVGPAPEIPPSGFVYVMDPPSLKTDDDLLRLVGRQVLHAFDEENIRGWFRGRVAARGVSNRDLKRTPTANFVVAFDKKVTGNRFLHGRVATTLTKERYGPHEWWVLLE